MRPSKKASRRILWLVFLFTIPLPYFLGVFETAPAARAIFLSAIILGVAATEGAGGYITAFVWLAASTALILPLILYALAALVARLIAGVPSEPLRSAALWSIAGALLVASLFEIYATPMSSRNPYSNLFEIFG